MDAISELRLGEVYPELARRVREVAGMLGSLNMYIRIAQALRTWPQQTELYNQGRTTAGKIVTHAKAGESYHNYGLAVDFVPMKDGIPIWDRSHPCYAKTIELAQSLGLVSGSCWPEPKTDFPHLQLTGQFPEAAPDQYCLYLFTEGGLTAVWKEVDKNLGIVEGEMK